MSRYDDLRRMREARFAIKAAAPDETLRKWSRNLLRNLSALRSVGKPADVTKPNKGGRPSIGDKPMTAAERMRRYRERKRQAAP
jgi:hypothetical protein